MAADEQTSKRRQFKSPVDIIATLEGVGGSDYLDVSDARAIIIYNRGILNLKVVKGRLDSAKEVIIEVFDLPPERADTDADAFIEKFIQRFIESNES